jgi:hypothetical protein
MHIETDTMGKDGIHLSLLLCETGLAGYPCA